MGGSLLFRAALVAVTAFIEVPCRAQYELPDAINYNDQNAAYFVHPQLVYVPGGEGESRWRLVVAPYLWAAGMKGTVTSNGAPAKVDMSFTDILSDLKYGVIGHGELFYDRFFLLTDTNLTRVVSDAEVDKKFSGPLGGTIEGKLKAELDSKTLIQELMAGYRVYESHVDASQERMFSMDLFGGMRYYNMQSTVDASAQVTEIPPGGPPPIQRFRQASVTTKEDWIDPVVGARVKYDVMRNVSLSLRGDVGGFGVGSNLSWSTTALAEWRFRKNLSLVGGYKILDIDYKNGGFGYDVRMQGPASTLAFKFEF